MDPPTSTWDAPRLAWANLHTGGTRSIDALERSVKTGWHTVSARAGICASLSYYATSMQEPIVVSTMSVREIIGHLRCCLRLRLSYTTLANFAVTVPARQRELESLDREVQAATARGKLVEAEKAARVARALRVMAQGRSLSPKQVIDERFRTLIEEADAEYERAVAAPFVACDFLVVDTETAAAGGPQACMRLQQAQMHAAYIAKRRQICAAWNQARQAGPALHAQQPHSVV